jgi:hypothetical protein
LSGNLTINGGSGASFVEINQLTLGKHLRVVQGVSTAGEKELQVLDSTIGGNLLVTNGAGDTVFNMAITDDGNTSSIGGRLAITNAAGEDNFSLGDTGVGGSVVVRNGRGSSLGQAGHFLLFNAFHFDRSVIGGSVKLSYRTGEVIANDIGDCEIMGSVVIRNGTGAARTGLGAFKVLEPVLVHGNLRIAGSGPATSEIGDLSWQGVKVDKNVTITTGAQADTLEFRALEVGLATTIKTLGGADIISIDDSLFHGSLPTINPVSFRLLTGSGNDTVSIDTATITTAATVFERVARIDLGRHDDSLTLGFTGDATRQVDHLQKIVFLGNIGNDTLNQWNLVSIAAAAVITDVFETVT